MNYHRFFHQPFKFSLPIDIRFRYPVSFLPQILFTTQVYIPYNVHLDQPSSASLAGNSTALSTTHQLGESAHSLGLVHCALDEITILAMGWKWRCQRVGDVL